MNSGVPRSPVLFIPGMSCSAEIFHAQALALWPYASVMIAAVQPGETVAAMTSSLLANAPPRFALVGVSLGGFIALEIMRQAPHRVERLALLATNARADTAEQSQARLALIERARIANFGAFGEELFTDIMLAARRTEPAMREVARRMAEAVGLDAFERQVRTIMSRPDSRPFLGRIAVPTLILVGHQDEVSPPAIAQEMADLIPGANLIIVENCGHAPTLEQPDAVNRALVAWLHDERN